MYNYKLAKSFFLTLVLMLLCVSCGEEGLIEPHGDTRIPAPITTGTLQAIDFPTDNGFVVDLC